MSLLTTILQRVDDREPVISRMEKSLALKGLVEDYQKYTLDNAMLPTLTSLTTGAELKDAIRQLSPEEQLVVLKRYSDTIQGVVSESPDKAEERKTRRWLVKFFSAVASAILLIMVATLVSVVIKGDSSDSASLITSVLSTTLEIIKLIFGWK